MTKKILAGRSLVIHGLVNIDNEAFEEIQYVRYSALININGRLHGVTPLYTNREYDVRFINKPENRGTVTYEEAPLNVKMEVVKYIHKYVSSNLGLRSEFQYCEPGKDVFILHNAYGNTQNKFFVQDTYPRMFGQHCKSVTRWLPSQDVDTGCFPPKLRIPSASQEAELV